MQCTVETLGPTKREENDNQRLRTKNPRRFAHEKIPIAE